MTTRPSADAVLRALGDGATTAVIAQELKCSPSAANARLDALRDQGRIERVMDEKKRLVWRKVTT